MKSELVIVGAGGCAREVEWAVRSLPSSAYDVKGFVVSDQARLSARDSKDRVLGNLEWLKSRHQSAVLIGIGDPVIRARVARQLNGLPHLVPRPTVVASSLALGSGNEFGQGTVICPGAVVTVNATIGADVLVHYGATISHESVIGDCSVISPGAVISGGVRIGANVLIGAGAVILQYLEIGEGSTIGAGAVVTKNVKPGAVVIGTPARPIDDESRVQRP